MLTNMLSPKPKPLNRVKFIKLPIKYPILKRILPKMNQEARFKIKEDSNFSTK